MTPSVKKYFKHFPSQTFTNHILILRSSLSMSRRSNRQAKPSKNAGALERMRRQRAGEDLSEEDSEDDVYDVVDEQQYKEIVRARRNQEDFVVDDDGTGYYDDGEEHLFEADDSKDSAKSKKAKHPQFRNQSSDKKKSKKGGALSRVAMEKAREAHREKLSAESAGSRNIGAMFLGRLRASTVFVCWVVFFLLDVFQKKQRHLVQRTLFPPPLFCFSPLTLCFPVFFVGLFVYLKMKQRERLTPM